MSGTVFFDLDGTLTDPFEGISRCIRFALEPFDVPAPDDETLASFIGPPLLDTFSLLLGRNHADEALRRYRHRFDNVGWLENRLYPGVSGALTDIRGAGHTLHVATSKPRVFAERIVQHFGLTASLSRIYGSELDGRRSDKTELLAWAWQQEGNPADSVMIGDRRHDMIGATNNNMFAIGVAWGYGSVDELEAAGAAHIVHKPGDITGLLIAP